MKRLRFAVRASSLLIGLLLVSSCGDKSSSAEPVEGVKATKPLAEPIDEQTNSVSAPSPTDTPVLASGHPKTLVGTWEALHANYGFRISYKKDGTWSSNGRMKMEHTEDLWIDTTSEGTWEIRNGAIHSTTIKSEPDLDTPLPYISVAKLVSVSPREYRYICPNRHSTNRMVRVSGKAHE